MKSCSQYTIIDSGSAGLYGILEYPLLHHYDDALNPTLDINFALCDFMYYDDYTPTDNNLYNSYWRRTISQINTGKMLIAYFNLKEDDIQKLKLNDKIRIDNSWWSINKIIDYDANNKQLTKVELLSTDSEIDFAPFKTKKPIKPHGAFSAIFTGVNQTITDNSNLVGKGADVIIKGKNNIVMPNVKAVIEGDGFVVSENGIYKGANGINVNGENFANADLTFTGNRSHSTNGYELGMTTDGGNYNEGWIYLDTNESSIGHGTNQVFIVDSTKAKIIANGKDHIECNNKTTRLQQSVSYSVYTTTTNYTINDSNYIVDCANTITVTLPTAVGRSGVTYVIKNSGVGVVTLDGNGTETIDGALTLTLATKVCYTVASDGSNWIILNSF